MPAWMHVSLRRAGTLAGAIADQLRAPAPVAAAKLDLGSAAAALRRVGAEVAQVRVDARREPWTPAGLAARQGASITWLACGDSWIGTRRGPHLDAGLQLRLRTGMGGPAVVRTGATFTAAAPHEGPIELCSLFPCELRDDDERIAYDRIMPRALPGPGCVHCPTSSRPSIRVRCGSRFTPTWRGDSSQP